MHPAPALNLDRKVIALAQELASFPKPNAQLTQTGVPGVIQGHANQYDIFMLAGSACQQP